MGNERELGSIETTLKFLKAGQIKIVTLLETQNDRVRKLENWRAGMVAIGGVLLFAIPIVIRLLW